MEPKVPTFWPPPRLGRNVSFVSSIFHCTSPVFPLNWFCNLNLGCAFKCLLQETVRSKNIWFFAGWAHHSGQSCCVGRNVDSLHDVIHFVLMKSQSLWDNSTPWELVVLSFFRIERWTVRGPEGHELNDLRLAWSKVVALKDGRGAWWGALTKVFALWKETIQKWEKEKQGHLQYPFNKA